MGWWHETTEFVSGGFGGLFAWDKAHAIFGTVAAFVSIAFAVRQLAKRRTAQHELEVKSVRLGVVEKELNTKSAQLCAAEQEIEAKQKKLDIIERAAHSHETHLWDLWPKKHQGGSAENGLLFRVGLLPSPISRAVLVKPLFRQT